MSDSNIVRKENSHNAPTHFGYRKDFNDLVNNFFNGWFDLPLASENQSFKNIEPKVEI